MLDPRGYFERRPEPLAIGLGVFGVYLLALSVFSYTLVSLMSRTIDAPSAVERRAILAVLVGVLFGGCLALLGIAAVMHYGTGRTGRYRDAVAVAGWAYVPNLLSLPVEYLLARERLAELEWWQVSSPEALRAELEAAQGGGTVSILLSLGVVLWSVYILGYGVAATHERQVTETLTLATLVGIVAFVASLF